MSQQIVTVSHIQKSFKQRQVLKDVSFSVDKGSIFTLLGSNGSGKTTLIKILSTLLKADRGHAFINQWDVTSQAEAVRSCISLTGQFVAVDDVLTARENLTLIGQLLRLANIKQVVSDWLAVSQLEEAADRPVSTYSGGMRRRLDITMSLMGDPQVIFLDEPTTGLDPQNRLAMWDLIKDLANKGTTVILTTQYLEEAEYLADTVAILHEGRLIAQGSPTNLKEFMPERGISLHFDHKESGDIAVDILKNNGITADSIEQDLPSLEDVFLTLINEKRASNQ